MQWKVRCHDDVANFALRDEKCGWLAVAAPAFFFYKHPVFAWLTVL